MTISENLENIKQYLPDKVKLVAVSKTKSENQILEAYQCGQRRFGENKVQELVSKWQSLPKDIEWHFIGHLQTNKVKQLVPFISLIHGVDSYKLLEAIDREAKKCNRIVPVLLEFHIASEDSKFGLTLLEAEELIAGGEIDKLRNITLAGVMGMATFTEDTNQISSEFELLNQIYLTLKEKYFMHDPVFSEISMGMSDDYPIAVSHGSTMIRVGSKIFGSRNYGGSE